MAKRKSKTTPAPKHETPEAEKPAEQVAPEVGNKEEDAPAQEAPEEPVQEEAPAPAEDTAAASDSEQAEAPAVEVPIPEQGGNGEAAKDEAQDSGGDTAPNEAAEPVVEKDSGGIPDEPEAEQTEEDAPKAGGPAEQETSEKSADPESVLQRRARAAIRWAEKQGWGPTEIKKLAESAPELVGRGWLWQNDDGTRDFVEAVIPEDRAEFFGAVAAVKITKTEPYWFLWNERLRDV